jgi:hypothetical protein
MEEIKPGDLVYLTRHFDVYMRRKGPKVDVIYSNRIGKLEEILDWESEKGRLIKQGRINSGKWTGLPMDSCKYLVTVYYPELIGRKGEKGVIEPCVPMFRYHPKTEEPFFEKLPDWFFNALVKAPVTFNVEKNVP